MERRDEDFGRKVTAKIEEDIARLQHECHSLRVTNTNLKERTMANDRDLKYLREELQRKAELLLRLYETE